ncbi:hypothetical protein [Halorhabdus sp. SVX81]|uniref:hypothetical protein n=1 Tax=Halorhabdus sp. SVX81 TaxID=2978283 RepID=UPI0023DB33F0|nr:hypothetical protein [Halorhabdus sp. SVX81]
MSLDKTIWIAVLILAAVMLVVKMFANSVSRLLIEIGIPSEVATDISSIVFFGGLLLLIVLGLRALSRFS